MELYNLGPVIVGDVFVAPNATIAGTFNLNSRWGVFGQRGQRLARYCHPRWHQCSHVTIILLRKDPHQRLHRQQLCPAHSCSHNIRLTCSFGNPRRLCCTKWVYSVLVHTEGKSLHRAEFCRVGRSRAWGGRHHRAEQRCATRASGAGNASMGRQPDKVHPSCERAIGVGDIGGCTITLP